MQDERPLRNRVALVTGGGTGFGLAAAQALADAGADVVITGRRAGKLAFAVARITKAESEGDALSVTSDIRVPESVESLMETIAERKGRLDILVNNAGVMSSGALHENEPERLQEVVQTNLLGAMLVTHAALPLMKKHDYGRIINVTSGLGWKPIPGFSAYAATKSGVNAFTRTLAQELAGWNILVNAIDPGQAKTDLNPSGQGEPDKIAPGIRRLATLPGGGPSGKIYKKDGETEIRLTAEEA